MTTVAFMINGKPASVEADAETPLLWIVREHLKLTGTKFGCGIANVALAPCTSMANRCAHASAAFERGRQGHHDDRRPVVGFKPSAAKSLDS